MQHADVDRAGHRLAELRQEALGRVLLGEAHAVDGDVERPRREPHGLGAAGEHRDRVGQRQLPRDPRLGVMVAADDEGRDLGLVQPSKLIGEKARGLHRRLLAVVEVAGDQKRIDFLVEAKLDNGRERPPGRPADEIGERRVAQRERAQGRIEVNVGGVNESEGHRRLGAKAYPPGSAKSSRAAAETVDKPAGRPTRRPFPQALWGIGSAEGEAAPAFRPRKSSDRKDRRPLAVICNTS